MILFDGTPIQSDHRQRGVGYYVKNLLGQFEEHPEWAITVFGSNVDGQLLSDQVKRSNIRWSYRPHRPAQVYWLWNEWALRQHLMPGSYRVFHATDFNGVVTSNRWRTIATLYDLTPLSLGFTGKDLGQRASDWRWQIYFKHKLPRADQIIAISQDAKEQAVDRLHLNPQQIVVIPLGVDLDHFRPIEAVVSDAPPYFLYVGALNPNKNVDRILQAFSLVVEQHPTIELHLAGAWDARSRIDLENTIVSLGLQRRVKLLGFVLDNKLPFLYAQAIGFVFPSLFEGFGLPVLEAMASGTPVVTSNRGALKETAGSAAILVNPMQVEDIANGMVLCLNDKTNRYWVEQGLHRVKGFSWAQVAEKTVAVYRQLL